LVGAQRAPTAAFGGQSKRPHLFVIFAPS